MPAHGQQPVQKQQSVPCQPDGLVMPRSVLLAVTGHISPPSPPRLCLALLSSLNCPTAPHLTTVPSPPSRALPPLFRPLSLASPHLHPLPTRSCLAVVPHMLDLASPRRRPPPARSHLAAILHRSTAPRRCPPRCMATKKGAVKLLHCTATVTSRKIYQINHTLNLFFKISFHR